MSDIEDLPPLDSPSGSTRTNSSGETRNGCFHTSAHPLTLFFTLFFKCVAFISYVLLYAFIDNYVLTFIVIILSLSFDFWFIKKISGRLLVGLRWSNYVHPDGTSSWVFEASKTKNPPRIDKVIFWSCLYLSPVVWVVFGVLFSGLKPTWLVIVAIAVFFNVTNLIGYWRCLRNGTQRVKHFVTKKAVEAALDSVQV